MADEPISNIPTDPKSGLSPWQRPEVQRIDANQAEITPGGVGDAGNLS